MALKSKNYQFFINNEYELCTNMGRTTPGRIKEMPSKYLFATRGKGLCLPEDRQVLAELIIWAYRYVNRNEQCELKEFREVWLQECVNCNISRTKGKGLFVYLQKLSFKEKFQKKMLKSPTNIADSILKHMLEKIDMNHLNISPEAARDKLRKDLTNYFDKIMPYLRS